MAKFREATMMRKKCHHKQDEVDYVISAKGRWGYWCDHVNKDYRLCLALLGCTGLYRAVLGCTLLYSAILGCTGLNWSVLNCTGLYWAVLGCSGLYWTVLGCTGLYWAVLGVKR